MYQILQKFDMYWHDGGPSIAMMYHLRRVSDLLCNWKSCLLCYMKDVVLHYSILLKWNKLLRVRVRVRVWKITRIYNCLDGGHHDGSSQDGSAGMAGDHGDNPWKFRNYVMIYWAEIVLRSAKSTGNEKEWWVSHYGVVFLLNWILIFNCISDWSVLTFPFDWDVCGECRQMVALYIKLVSVKI